MADDNSEILFDVVGPANLEVYTGLIAKVAAGIFLAYFSVQELLSELRAYHHPERR